MQKDGWVLGAVFVEDHLENTLILGIMDKETESAPRNIQRSLSGAFPHVVTSGRRRTIRLLYTFNGQETASLTVSGGWSALDGEFMAWEWRWRGTPATANASPTAPQGLQRVTAYWTAIWPCGPAARTCTRQPGVCVGGDSLSGSWTTRDLLVRFQQRRRVPMPIYFQSLNWLIRAHQRPRRLADHL